MSGELETILGILALSATPLILLGFFLWPAYIRPWKQKRAVLRDYPAGTKVRIKSADPLFARYGFEVVGLVGTVMDHTFYNFIPPRINVEVNLRPAELRGRVFTTRFSFNADQLEQVPDLQLVTTAELKRTYELD